MNRIPLFRGCCCSSQGYAHICLLLIILCFVNSTLVGSQYIPFCPPLEGLVVPRIYIPLYWRFRFHLLLFLFFFQSYRGCFVWKLSIQLHLSVTKKHDTLFKVFPSEKLMQWVSGTGFLNHLSSRFVGVSFCSLELIWAVFIFLTFPWWICSLMVPIRIPGDKPFSSKWSTSINLRLVFRFVSVFKQVELFLYVGRH